MASIPQFVFIIFLLTFDIFLIVSTASTTSQTSKRAWSRIPMSLIFGTRWHRMSCLTKSRVSLSRPIAGMAQRLFTRCQVRSQARHPCTLGRREPDLWEVSIGLWQRLKQRPNQHATSNGWTSVKMSTTISQHRKRI